jgi:hypothetical protein
MKSEEGLLEFLLKKKKTKGDKYMVFNEEKQKKITHVEDSNPQNFLSQSPIQHIMSSKRV